MIRKSNINNNDNSSLGDLLETCYRSKFSEKLPFKTGVENYYY